MIESNYETTTEVPLLTDYLRDSMSALNAPLQVAAISLIVYYTVTRPAHGMRIELMT